LFRFLIAGVVLALMTGFSGSAAQAQTQTVNFIGGKSGKTEPFKVSLNGGASFLGPLSVGVYEGTLSGEPTLGNIEMFCVDIRHDIGTPFETLALLGDIIDPAESLIGSYYQDASGHGGGMASAMNPSDYNPTLPGTGAFDTVAKRVAAVSYLAGKYLNSAFPKETLSRVQMAIWDIVQDGGDGANQGNVQAKDTSDNFVDISAILTEAAGQTGAAGPRWIQAPRVGGNPDNHFQDLVYLPPPPVQICGTVFCDHDKDCHQDEGEPGIAGVEVVLEGDVDGDGDADTVSATTDEHGRYCFTDLRAGHYTVTVIVPDGMSSIGPTTLEVAATTPGTTYDGNNFCLDGCACEDGKICGIIFCDDDGDGTKDRCEPSLSFVPVWLKDANGHVLKDTRTDCDGRYCFRGLKPGTYMVCVKGVVYGLLLIGERCVTVKVECGKITRQDFRYKGGAICGYAYYDKNRNCKKDADEPGLGGVWIKLKDCWGYYRWAKTDCNGLYCFDDCLPGGSYKVYAPGCVDGKYLRTSNPLYVCIDPGEVSNNNNFGYR